MEAEKKGREKVCVTGAAGFIASWFVELLLSKGYIVHGTVRDPSTHEKNAHLWSLDKAPENLKLFKADLLDYDSLRSAIEGCSGVFHAASPVIISPVPDPELEVIEPAVKGTSNVLKASLEAKVKRVVYVSSLAAVGMNPNLPKGQVIDETCRSDEDYCRKMEKWYCLSKTLAEKEAFGFAEGNGIDVVTVCPSLTLGPLLQPTVNASSKILVDVMKGVHDPVPNRIRNIGDARDVAAAIVLAYEKPEAKGRYICTGYPIKMLDLVNKLRSLYPGYSYPTTFTDIEENVVISTRKLQGLGWTARPLEETLVDSVESFRRIGIL
ncbi:cinnamoyl-CoA reductase 2-like [Punica granatum]|uniref:Cinnamoyl-CoA reductase 2-like n=1 Tax=Punica granatum TaxID=22663 RepID=A0A6P8E247_PUNGR|nr:cinnamoyl-CoA reductase 2-like [Punica granatum]